MLENGLQEKIQAAAVRYLEARGSEVLAENYGCAFGTIDFVALDGEVVCFVEVTARAEIENGFLEREVTPKLRSSLEKIAACFLQDHQALCGCSVRFDALSFLVIGEDRALLRYHINRLDSIN